MHRFQCVLLAAVTVIGFASVASAADMPVKGPVYKTPVAISSSWTGFYVGGSVGARWADVDWDTTGGFTTGNDPDPSTRSANFDSTSFRGGLYVGYNWQFAPLWIVGVEGDIAWADNSKTIATLPGIDGPRYGYIATPADSTSVREKSDASVRGRLGYLVSPALMAYATGGVSWLRIETQATCGVAGTSWCFPSSHNETYTTTKAGWTIGGGLEWMLAPNWLARAEYRYADYGTVSQRFFPNSDTFSANIKVTTHTALVGLAYKFGSSP
jgi:outer membrane immunogenic protein